MADEKFQKGDRKPFGDKERKPFARRDDNKPAPRSEKSRMEKRERPATFEKRERPTTPRTTDNGEARMPKKTTAGSRTRTRKNNENK